ncbi:MAG: hypothetical protein HKO77_07125 [Gemmatimonadetes bacterium]|nr:hypothetical protein [Gemmatimonadota bacterium]
MLSLVLLGAVIGALVHARRDPTRRSPARTGELIVRYTLVAYCGLPMLLISIGILVAPEGMAEILPVGPSAPIVAFFGWAYLGMSLAAVLAPWYSGSALLAAAIPWAVYFAGATVVHLHGPGGHGHGGALLVFATHGLVSVILVAGLAMARPGARVAPPG